MNKEWVACVVCGTVFERDVLIPTSKPSFPSIAVCNACIRRKDLDEIIPQKIQGLQGSANE